MKEAPRENSGIMLTRRKFCEVIEDNAVKIFLGTLITGSVTAVYIDYKNRKKEGKEKKEIPTIELEKVIAHPDLFTKDNGPVFKTSGYPEFIDRKTTYIPMPIFVENPGVGMEAQEVDSYRLLIDPSIEGIGMEFSTETRYPAAMPVPRPDPLTKTKKYELTGSLIEIKDEKQRKKYTFQPTEINELPPHNPQPIK